MAYRVAEERGLKWTYPTAAGVSYMLMSLLLTLLCADGVAESPAVQVSPAIAPIDPSDVD